MCSSHCRTFLGGFEDWSQISNIRVLIAQTLCAANHHTSAYSDHVLSGRRETGQHTWKRGALVWKCEVNFIEGIHILFWGWGKSSDDHFAQANDNIFLHHQVTVSSSTWIGEDLKKDFVCLQKKYSRYGVITCLKFIKNKPCRSWHQMSRVYISVFPLFDCFWRLLY